MTFNSSYPGKDQVMEFLTEISYPWGLKNFYNKVFLTDKNMVFINDKYQMSHKLRDFTPNDRQIELICIKIRSGIEFLNLGEKSSMLLKPILLYYGINHIYSAFIDLIFENTIESHHHGLYNDTEIDDETREINWKVLIKNPKNNYGFFKKLVYSIDLLRGNVSNFTRILVKNDSFMGKSYHDKYEVKGIGIDNKFVIDIIGSYNKIEEIYDSKPHDRQYLFNITLLFNYMLLYTFCETLRYKPDIWSEFMIGDSKMFMIMQNTYKRIYDDIWDFTKCLTNEINLYSHNFIDFMVKKKEYSAYNRFNNQGFFIQILRNSIFNQMFRKLILGKKDERNLPLPTNINDFEELRYLSAQNCNISSIPEQMGDLSHIETMVLSNNFIISLPETMGNLSKLKKLILNNNKLESFLKNVDGLKNLKTLDLENNKLEFLPESFGELKNIEYLKIAGNPIRELPNSITDLMNLKKIYFPKGFTSFSEEQRNWITKLINKNCSVFPNHIIN